MNTKVSQIRQKLSSLGRRKLSSEHKFSLRPYQSKVDVFSFLLGFFEFFLSVDHSLSAWAERISLLSGHGLSKQGLDKRLNDRVQSFSEALLKGALSETVFQAKDAYSCVLFESFPQVWVEDSTCFSLPRNLHSVFPGSHSRRPKDKVATAKLQVRMELTTESVRDIQIQSYRNNDQAHAPCLVKDLEAGELVIRDLGYWSLDSLKAILNQQAHLLTRYRYGVSLFDLKTKHPLDLNTLLNKAKRKGKSVVDIEVEVGKVHRLSMRMVALKAPEKITAQRRRKARANRHHRARHSEKYLQLLEWTIFLTSVEHWRPKQVAEAYGYRWRIEVIFKCWKSHLKLELLFSAKKSLKAQRVYIMIYLALVWICLFLMPWLRAYTQSLYREKGKYLSILKFTRFAKNHFSQLIEAENNLEKQAIIKISIAHACVHERRKNRTFFIQKMIDPNLG